MDNETALFKNRILQALVAWCGLWQAIHLTLNIKTAFLGATDFPPPPPEGWTSQTWNVFDGMVVSDIVQAALCLVFVVGFWLKRRWSVVLGAVCLGSSAFNSFAFTYFMVKTGAWQAHEEEYIGIQVLWAPLFILFLWLFRALSRDQSVRERSPNFDGLRSGLSQAQA